MGEDLSPGRAASRRLAVEVRHLIDLLARSEAPEGAFDDASAHVADIVARLKAFPNSARWYGYAELANAGEEVRDRMRYGHFDHSPLIGIANPVAPPMSMWVDGNRVVGECTFGDAYEGPPGIVHGGFVAAAFDELLGMTQSLSGTPGMTANLSINYRRPTPLRTLIRYEGRLVRVEGRKIFTEASSFAGEVLTAQADGLFLSILNSRFAELAAERDRAMPPPAQP